jgi:hypothetical protein
MLGMLGDQAVGWVRAGGPPTADRAQASADAVIKRLPAVALPHRVADSSDHRTARLLSTLHDEEPVKLSTSSGADQASAGGKAAVSMAKARMASKDTT